MRDRGEPGGRAVGRLAQQQQRDGADDHGPGDVAGRLRLGDLAHQTVAGEVECGAGPDLGHQVVVVRVEPLRHLERGLVALAARDGEVAGQVEGAVVGDEVGEALRDRTDGDRRIQHLVVVRERLGDRGVGRAEAERGETLARGGTQPRGGLLELVDADVVLPEGLDRALELAATADAGVAQDRAGGEGGGAGHAGILFVSSSPAPSRTASGASGAVEGVQVDAGRAAVEQGTCQPRGMVDADLGGRLGAVGAIRARASRSAGAVSPLSSSTRCRRGTLSTGMMPGRMRMVTPAARASSTNDEVVVGVEEQLRDGEVGSGRLLRQQGVEILLARPRPGVPVGEGRHRDRDAGAAAQALRAGEPGTSCCTKGTRSF